MKHIRALALFSILLVVLAACSNSQSAVAPAAQPAANGTDSASAPQVIVVPTPASSQVGVVTGKLFRLPSESNTSTEPLTTLHVYLASLIKTSQGLPLASLSKDTAPNATVDSQGTFVFSNVTPGSYGLMLDTPQGVVLLNRPDNGSDLIVDVKGGNVTDLGELKYKFNF